MRSAGIFEVKQNLSAIVDAAEAGEAVVITRHGKPVARIVPFHAAPAQRSQQAQRDLRRMQRLRAAVKPGPGWKELRDEGRRF